MSTTATDTPDAAAAPRRAFIPRLGSALAFFPIGAWTVLHLWDNLWAFRGAGEWERHVTAERSPIVELIVAIVVLLPIVLHTIWGIRRILILRPNLVRYSYFDNLKFVLQRLAALGLAAFIPAHVYLARVEPLLRTGHHEHFSALAGQMFRHTPTLIVYLLGILGTAYHLGNGVATGGMTWGYAASPRAMRRMSVYSMLFFVILLIMGYGAVWALYTAGSQVPESVSHPGAPEVPTTPATNE